MIVFVFSDGDLKGFVECGSILLRLGIIEFFDILKVVGILNIIIEWSFSFIKTGSEGSIVLRAKVLNAIF